MKDKKYLVCLGTEEEQVEGYGGYDVDDEPSPEVVDGNLAGVADHLVVWVDVRGPEVDEDVDDEHDVDEQVDDDDRIVVVLPVPLIRLLLAEEKSGDVWRENGRVHHQQQDDPVPDRLEWRIVQDRPLVHGGLLQLVLGKYVGTQRKHLERIKSNLATGKSSTMYIKFKIS